MAAPYTMLKAKQLAPRAGVKFFNHHVVLREIVSINGNENTLVRRAYRAHARKRRSFRDPGRLCLYTLPNGINTSFPSFFFIVAHSSRACRFRRARISFGVKLYTAVTPPHHFTRYNL